VRGYSNEEICELLDLSPVNQRVLLHRARVALRDALDSYYAERRTSTTPAGMPI
jgi:RNA polymerase sigma-70 factor (ECF subfamily)